jgi:hypothetical protein
VMTRPGSLGFMVVLVALNAILYPLNCLNGGLNLTAIALIINGARPNGDVWDMGSQTRTLARHTATHKINPRHFDRGLLLEDNGEGGIRTHGKLPYTAFPVLRLRPLGHFSMTTFDA